MKISKCVSLWLTIFCICILIPDSARCELKFLDDGEMSAVYAEGFSTLSITHNNVTGYDECVAHFNIDTYQYTEIDSLKLGYHDEYDYKDPTPGFGWDEDWTNVKIGGDVNDPSKDFHTQGLWFKAEFTNINQADQRQLKSISFGADYVEGPITADFNKFSGTIDDSGNNTPEYDGHGLVLGTKTITTDWDNAGPTPTTGAASSFSMSLNIDGFDKGYWVNFTRATVTP